MDLSKPPNMPAGPPGPLGPSPAGHPPQRRVLTVSQLTRQIQSLLEDHFPFVWLCGEISNFKAAVSGHYYFTLKDATAQISAVMFRGQSRSLKFFPEDGMRITGFGRISVYPPRGGYQIILEYLEPAGLGALQAAFEQLKAKLAAEGLFDESRKQPIPFLPDVIHLITSPTGAVVHDMIRVIRRRCPRTRLAVIPVQVQGDAAVSELTAAIGLVNRLPDAQVAILARGGGSLEDLAAFNAESLARAIAASHVPIISAVGHETDVTIADFVADLRAPTPSAAAELVIPVQADLAFRIQSLHRTLHIRVQRHLTKKHQTLLYARKRLLHPRRRLDAVKMRLDETMTHLSRTLHRHLARKRDHLHWRIKMLEKRHPSVKIAYLRQHLHRNTLDLSAAISSIILKNQSARQSLDDRLRSLNPLAVMQRGYSITRTYPDRRVINSASDVNSGQLLEILLANGSILCQFLKELSDGEKKNI